MAFLCAYSASRSAFDRMVERLDVMASEEASASRIATLPEDQPSLAVWHSQTTAVPTDVGAEDGGLVVFVYGRFYRSQDDAKQNGNAGGAELLRSPAAALAKAYTGGLEKVIEVVRGNEFTGVISLWDPASCMLHVFRDRVGSVPVYYGESAGAFVWGTGLRRLKALHGGASTTNRAAVDAYLTGGFIPAPLTMLQGISKLPMGYLLTVSEEGKSQVRPYWYPSARGGAVSEEMDKPRQISDLLQFAILRRLGDPERTGLLLSSGVDSKLLLALLARKLDVRPQCFTFRYTGYEGQLNEGVFAKACADHFGARHEEVDFGPEDVAKGMQAMVRAFGEPFAYGLHTFKLGEVRSSGIHELFSGVGADGWYINSSDRRILSFMKLPGAVRAAGELAIAGLEAVPWRSRTADPLTRKGMVARIIDRASDIARRARFHLPVYHSWLVPDDDLRSALYADRTWVSAAHATLDSYFREADETVRSEPDAQKFKYMGLRYFSADNMMNWNYCCAEAHGLLIHTPFQDTELLRFVHSFPMTQPGKPDLRRLAETIMPKEMANTPKLAQGIPIGHWFRGSLKDFLLDNVTIRRLKENGIFDVTAVQQLLNAHIEGRRDMGWLLWCVLSILVCEQVLTQPME